MTQNQISWFRANEEKRHNVTTEVETGRHNVVDESIRYEANQINREANVINQMHFERMDSENARHNMAQEDIGYANIKLGYAGLDETSRHNRVTEQLTAGQLAEAERHNRKTEKQTTRQLNQNTKYRQETVRHNMMTEQIGISQANAASLSAQASMASASAAQSQAATAQQRMWNDYELGSWSNRIQSRDARTRERQQGTLSKQQLSQANLNDERAWTELLMRQYNMDYTQARTFAEYIRSITGTISATGTLAGNMPQ